MKIESDDYYRIVLQPDLYEAGQKLLDEILTELSSSGRQIDAEKLLREIQGAYARDIRCLIGFALCNTEYEFGVGGLSHVIGNQLVKPLRLLKNVFVELQHPSSSKISKMAEVVEVTP